MELRNQLTSIEEKDSSVLSKSEASILACAGFLEEIRLEVITKGFTNEEEEIRFFKHIKPKFASEYIFQIDLYNFRKSCPEGDEQMIRTFVRREQKKINYYLEDHKFYDEYFKLNVDYNDQIYFVRGEYNFKHYADRALPDADPLFVTMMDPLLSRIISAKRLQEYLTHIADTGNLTFKTTMPWLKGTEEDIKWTGKAAELLMLIYALCEAGVFNNGNAKIGDVIKQFEEMFKIQLGHPYDAFYKIKMRKTGAIKFIQKLQDGLDRKLDDVE
jgi:hypothetical protein